MKVIISFLFFFVILPVYVLSQVPEYAKIKIDFVIHQDGEQINLFEGEVFRFFPEVSGILFFNDTIPLDTSVFQVVNITSNKRTPRIIFGEVSLASDNLNEHMDRVAQKKYARISVDGLPSVFLNYEEQQSIPEENGKDLEGNLLERNIKDESTEPHVVAYYLLTVFLSFILGFFLRPFLARKKQRQLRQTSEQKEAEVANTKATKGVAEPEDNRQTDLNPGLEKKDSTASEDRFFLEKSVYGEFSDRALGLVKQVGWVVEECRTIKREAKKNDEGKMAAFILEGIYQKHEQSGVDSEIEKWEGILERLQKDGTVIDPFLVSALEDTINGEHYNRTLQRTFYFEFVKKVVPQVVILQEEFRNIPHFLSPTYRLSDQLLTSISKLEAELKNLLSCLKQDLGVDVVYVPLLTPLAESAQDVRALDVENLPDYYRELITRAQTMSGQVIVSIQSLGIKSDYETTHTYVNVTGGNE